MTFCGQRSGPRYSIPTSETSVQTTLRFYILMSWCRGPAKATVLQLPSQVCNTFRAELTSDSEAAGHEALACSMQKLQGSNASPSSAVHPRTGGSSTHGQTHSSLELCAFFDSSACCGKAGTGLHLSAQSHSVHPFRQSFSCFLFESELTWAAGPSDGTVAAIEW